MRTRESSLWSWLEKGAKAIGPSCLLERVENVVDVGCSDVFGINGGAAFVVELKSVDDGALIDCELKSEQSSFLRRWVTAGGSAWVLIRVGGRRYLVHAMDSHHLLKPIAKLRLLGISHINATDNAESIINLMSRGLK